LNGSNFLRELKGIRRSCWLHRIDFFRFFDWGIEVPRPFRDFGDCLPSITETFGRRFAL
jgi:hypothetical protein